MHELSRTSEDIIRNKTYNENDVGVEKLLRNVFLICSPLVLPQRRPSTFTLSGVWRGVVHPGASVGHTHVIKSGGGGRGCLFDPPHPPVGPSRTAGKAQRGEMRSVWAAAAPARGAGARHAAHFEGRGSNDPSLLRCPPAVLSD